MKLISSEADTEERRLGPGPVAVAAPEFELLLKRGITLQQRWIRIPCHAVFHFSEVGFGPLEIQKGSQSFFQNRCIAEVWELIQASDSYARTRRDGTAVGVVGGLDEAEQCGLSRAVGADQSDFVS